MASRNRLLGMGESVEEEKKVDAPVLQWMYSVGCPEGVLLTNQKDIDAFEKLGWKDHPGKVRLLPGHEHLFEGATSTDKIPLLSAFDEPAVKESKFDLSSKIFKKR
jgi:hypothetical protein